MFKKGQLPQHLHLSLSRNNVLMATPPGLLQPRNPIECLHPRCLSCKAQLEPLLSPFSSMLGRLLASFAAYLVCAPETTYQPMTCHTVYFFLLLALQTQACRNIIPKPKLLPESECTGETSAHGHSTAGAAQPLTVITKDRKCADTRYKRSYYQATKRPRAATCMCIKCTHCISTVLKSSGVQLWLR